MNNLIAVTIGDIKGVGIKILIDLYIKKKYVNFVLFCNLKILNNYLKKNKISLDINVVNNLKNKVLFKKNHLNVYNYITKSNSENTINSINISHSLCLSNKFIGLVTLPLRKDLIIKNMKKNFKGHTEYLQELEEKKYSNMILFHKKLIVSTLTTHVKLKSVSQLIKSNNFIYNKIKGIHLSLIKDFGIKKPNILVSGLNPHAGENGYIGNEEKEFIIPVINKLKKKGIVIHGPASADSMLNSYNLKSYNCFIFMFHDQALIPFKYISKFSGVNYTGNLDIIRTSPDHGTAYDIVNKKNISNKSLLNCFKLINKINKNRKKYGNKSKKITESKFYQ